MVPRPEKTPHLDHSYHESRAAIVNAGAAGGGVAILPPQGNQIQIIALQEDQLDHIVPPEPEIFLIASAPSQQFDNQEGEEANDTLTGNRNPMSNTSPQFNNDIFGIPMPFDVISAGYATLVAAGGVIGYAKAGSIPSLAAGLIFGGILGFGAYQTSVNPNNYYVTYGTSTALAGMMGWRFYNSGKFMPAGLVAALSLAMVARFSVRALASLGASNEPHPKQ